MDSSSGVNVDTYLLFQAGTVALGLHGVSPGVGQVFTRADADAASETGFLPQVLWQAAAGELFCHLSQLLCVKVDLYIRQIVFENWICLVCPAVSQQALLQCQTAHLPVGLSSPPLLFRTDPDDGGQVSPQLIQTDVFDAQLQSLDQGAAAGVGVPAPSPHCRSR